MKISMWMKNVGKMKKLIFLKKELTTWQVWIKLKLDFFVTSSLIYSFKMKNEMEV
jgi:hypothetical protein